MSANIVLQIARSGLKPVYILVIFVFAYFAMFFVMRMGADAGWWPRNSHHGELATRSGAIIIGVAMFALLREARAAMAEMFRASFGPVLVSDLLLALALTFSWCLGVHAMLVKFPTIWVEPDHYLRFWGYLGPLPATTVPSWILTATAVGILTPVLEEFYFRGMLLNSLRARRSLLTSVLVSAAAFGVIHGRATILAFGFGVIAALMFLRCRSLWLPIVVHGAYNISIILPGVPSLIQRKSLPEATAPGTWAVEIFLAIAFIPLAILFWRRFKPGEEARAE